MRYRLHRRAIDHYLTIAITGKPPSGEDFVIDFHAGPLNGRPFPIQVDPPTVKGVFASMPTPTQFDRSENNDDEDFQWAIALQCPEFHHNEQLETAPTGINPGLTMSDGVFTRSHLINICRVVLSQCLCGSQKAKGIYETSSKHLLIKILTLQNNRHIVSAF